METGRSRGFGFVKFDDARDADDAIAQADGKVQPVLLLLVSCSAPLPTVCMPGKGQVSAGWEQTAASLSSVCSTYCAVLLAASVRQEPEVQHGQIPTRKQGL